MVRKYLNGSDLFRSGGSQRCCTSLSWGGWQPEEMPKRETCGCNALIMSDDFIWSPVIHVVSHRDGDSQVSAYNVVMAVGNANLQALADVCKAYDWMILQQG